MPVFAPEDLTAQMQWRYACKKFDPNKPIAPASWDALEQSLVLAPSSFGLQPWKFVDVTDAETKAQLAGASWGQSQVRDAPHVIVFAARDPIRVDDVERFVDRVSHVRGVARDSLAGFRKMLLGFVENPPKGLDLREWAVRQTYIALGTFMTAAAAIGVDTCPLEGIEPLKYDQMLGLPELGYRTVVACAAGYRSPDDKYSTLPKVRFATENLILRR